MVHQHVTFVLQDRGVVDRCDGCRYLRQVGVGCRVVAAFKHLEQNTLSRKCSVEGLRKVQEKPKKKGNGNRKVEKSETARGKGKAKSGIVEGKLE